jgi:hypothetical protein
VGSRLLTFDVVMGDDGADENGQETDPRVVPMYIYYDHD